VGALLEQASSDQQTGARSVLEVLLDRLVGLINDLPSLLGTDISRIIVDADTIRHGKSPWKVPAGPVVVPQVDLDRLAVLARPLCQPPAAGQNNEVVRQRLTESKARLQWSSAAPAARRWWEALERESCENLGDVLRLAEDLLARKATIDEFFTARTVCGTDNSQAVLLQVDLTRIKKEEDRRRRSSSGTLVRELPVRFQTGERCLDGGTFLFDGYADDVGGGAEGPPSPPPGPIEQQITLQARQSFPPIASTGKPCWWRPLNK
jgi:hypothetical protein